MTRKSFTITAAVALTLGAAVAVANHHAKSEDEKGAHAGRQDASSMSMEKKAASTTSADGVSLYIISPSDGEVVSSPVLVQFGLRGKGVAPAGIDAPNTGHHHLFIDVEEFPDMTAPLPVSDNIRHFGGGQTEALIELKPGRHSLQLVLGDFAHRPHDPPVISEQILVTVQ